MKESIRRLAHSSGSKLHLATRCSAESGAVHRPKARIKRALCLLVLLLAAQAYPQSTGPEFPDPGKPGMSREEQRKIGLQAAAEVYKQMPVLPDDSMETKYVQQLGKKLVATVPPEYSWPFEFHVVAQKEINAFALPGGPMFINLGTITSAASEGELAGVMGHEMAHVYMQHSAKQAGKARTTGLLAGIAGAVLGASVGGAVAQLGQMGIQMTAQGVLMKYSRSDETEADAVGTVILYKAGYNPQAMADFFRTLEAQGGQSPPQFLSSHPNPGNRQQAIQKQIADWPPKEFVTDSPRFQEVRQHATGVKSYSAEQIAQGAKTGEWSALNKKNGFTTPGATAVPASASGAPAVSPAVSLDKVLPSQQMRTANLGPVKMDYPENWQVQMPKQQGDFITIAPKAGVVPNGVGYGVVVNGVAPSDGAAKNIDDMTRQLVQDLKQNGGLQPTGDAQSITVAGTEGRSITLQSASPFAAPDGQPQKEKDWLVTVPQPDGSLLFFIFVAPQKDFPRFQPTYQAMLKSVRF
jgi:beta-barrel assembly-enhancing protease